jgi:hypothetical protein
MSCIFIKVEIIYFATSLNFKDYNKNFPIKNAHECPFCPGIEWLWKFSKMKVRKTAFLNTYYIFFVIWRFCCYYRQGN